MAGLRWERLQGYHDLNRVIVVWSMDVLDLKPAPYADPVADGADVYNGSFVRGQVSSQPAHIAVTERSLASGSLEPRSADTLRVATLAVENCSAAHVSSIDLQSENLTGLNH